MPLFGEKSFEDLNLQTWLINACRNMRITRPTLIQEKCIPHLLAGKDLIARAKTGSGKTGAFALPILQILSEDPYGLFALVLTPTRELACQIADQFRAFGLNMMLKVEVIIGGQSMLDQQSKLHDQPHICVATPGRLSGLMREGTELHADHLRFLVLDEADSLLQSQDFVRDINYIVSKTNKDRQTVLVSATLTSSMPQVRDLKLANAAYEEISPNIFATVESVKQTYLFIPRQIKEAYLVALLEDWSDKMMIIFVSTCEFAQLLSDALRLLDIENVPLHSHLQQRIRLASLGKFRSGITKILIATDVAARGLDIPQVELVVNYDLPRQAEDYIHRIGRTGRAGRMGNATSFVTQYDIILFQGIEELIKKRLDKLPIEGGETRVVGLMSKVRRALREANVKQQMWALKDQFSERVASRKRRQKSLILRSKKKRRPYD